MVTTVPYTDLPGADSSRVDCLNRAYRGAVASRPGSKVLDLASWLCDGSTCRGAHGPTTLREDGVHFAGAGATVETAVFAASAADVVHVVAQGKVVVEHGDHREIGVALDRAVHRIWED